MRALSIYFGFIKRSELTLAMEAGVTDRLWSLEDVVEIVDEWEAAQTEKSNAAL
jgi:hypothetical protein